MMRALALSDEILMRVEKPARYIGNEINSVMKDKDRVDVRFVLCFPDVYEIGMSHFGIQILYDMLNRRKDVWCERVYSPWIDLTKIMKEKGIPLFALESQDPVLDFNFLGITIQYEMCYTNILQILDLSGIPLHAKERTWEHPIVIGGGPCVSNPEPLAQFFDIFYIGEAETSLGSLIDLYKECRAKNTSRLEFLMQASILEGVYVPRFYECAYNLDGTLKKFYPVREGVPGVVKRQVAKDLNKLPYPCSPVVPFIKATQDRAVLEIQRGCIRGCRFCQAGMLYRPFRERNVGLLKKYALSMLKNTGYDEITLSSLSSSDYPKLKELTDFLIGKCQEKKINISLPSLRIDSFSLDIMSKIQDVRKSSLTFAPEAGSQRLRDVVNKGITQEDILNGARLAFEGGWSKVKLYFMLGLPTETEEDVKGIAKLCERIAEIYEDLPKEKRMGRCAITASAAFFVPKPFTAFQWAKMQDCEEYIRRVDLLRQEFRKQKRQKNLLFHWHKAEAAVLEGAFSRGDRRVGRAIEEAYRLGCLYDSWAENFSYELWRKAFENAGLKLCFYTTRERKKDELFPWDFIDVGINKRFLLSEWEKADQGLTTPNCKQRCTACGASCFGGGVCFEGKS